MERLDAALLLADISGFTALTEALQRGGKDGAETVARLVSAAFQPAIEAVRDASGSILTFGGDALLAGFPGPRPVQRARRAAQAIEAALGARGAVRAAGARVTLRITQVIHHGNVAAYHLGSPDERLFVAAGPSLRELARAEESADRGVITITAAAAKALRRHGGSSPRAGRRNAGARAELAAYVPAALRSVLGRSDGAYRPVTVVFLETRGRGDAAILQRFARSLQRALAACGGVLLKTDISSSGIKWLCVMGLPAAHEDDGARAARMALEVQAHLPAGLALRGAIHAGTVASLDVGTAHRRSFDVMGDAVNTAARALGKAAWGEVWITEQTASAAGGISASPRGVHVVKGKSEPLRLLSLHDARAGTSRSRPTVADVALIGREAEVAAILRAIESALAGRPTLLGLRGDAGIGKSRLLEEASQLATARGFAVHAGRAPSFAGTELAPWREVLKSALGLGDDPTPPERIRSRVRDVATELGLEEMDRHHLGNILGVRYESSPIRHQDARTARQNDLIALSRCLGRLAERTPRAVLLEDMHGADDRSREAVAFLARPGSAGRLVVLLAYRGGSLLPDAPEIVVPALPPDAVASLLATLLGDAAGGLSAFVTGRAQGNPLFLGELSRWLRETGAVQEVDGRSVVARAPQEGDVPRSLESLLASRLDTLPPHARRAVSVASVIGQRFAPALVHAVAGAHAAAGLAEAAREEIVTVDGTEDGGAFRQSIIRDVAYGSILRTERRRLHRAVAEAILRLRPGPHEDDLEPLGHHWDHGGRPVRARPCYLRAAESAARRYALSDADRLYGRYVALVRTADAEAISARIAWAREVLRPQGSMAKAHEQLTLSVTEARRRKLRDAEARALHATATLLRDTGSLDDAARLCVEALALLRSLDRPAPVAAALDTLAVVEAMRNRLPEAEDLFRQALAISRQVGDRAGEASALAQIGNVYLERRSLAEAEALYEQALPLMREVSDVRMQGVLLGNLALVHAQTGRLPSALALQEQALALRRRVGDRHAEALALANLGGIHDAMGRPRDGAELYRKAAQLHQEIGNKRQLGRDLANLAAVLTAGGQDGEALKAMEEAVSVLRDAGDPASLVDALERLGRRYVAGGRDAEGQALLEEAARLSEANPSEEHS